MTATSFTLIDEITRRQRRRPDRVRLPDRRGIEDDEIRPGTEHKAADYLQGMQLLGQRDVAAAIPPLRSAVTAPGYEYADYALSLARALAQQGNAREARTFARQAGARKDLSDLRLDLERERAQAARLLAQLGG